ncbi:MAG: hypothetical protein EWV45_10505 [Microcystis flos-aquae Mf_QC_C_20070823_S10D]|uniref:Uncharacterized protein n=1 Tax=Microcystis flos-aquae Mf_QC_C_20070823_S10D TaxID=2486236 RepID=A0A552KVB3_9CHRO|nr:MAG: hypothetical protein EWV65_02640 [Microcystis flos-aquae Ma_QC_C_20070823_S18D]TRV11917.1 MAG: hypothetical protein EWV45_10505 [Microcystis flos-aquae Mf_QC_C_20070823_S10D]TRV21348.1 MAG: hypothetical protein EWV72_17680 [Microcystis flos-aquae Mf_QC_C_20070823_S10]TRV33188.1 MAG: hypothetical protein EWV44_18475 [Microcystis flos-aquae Mf_QC_C_20070823_S20T]TRV35706.1 MAG: hypothetical protein EWV70_09650 [Microcystis flos-aquae Mf_QC_C_20070823_S20]TRV37597.1 MAG: hypothetical prot
MAVPEQPKSSSLQKTVSSRLGSHKTVISHQLLDIYQLSVIRYQLSDLGFQSKVLSGKFRAFLSLITD